MTNEIVRQLLEQGGMYSLEKPIGDMKFMVDVHYVAAMNTPGGGKNDIPNRLKRQFALFNVPLPSVAAINGIFGRLVEGRFSTDVFADEVVFVASKLVPLTITLWNRTQVGAKYWPWRMVAFNAKLVQCAPCMACRPLSTYEHLSS